MAIRTIQYLKDRFGPGDAPRSSDYIDLIDTLADDRNAVYFSETAPTDTDANPLWFNTSSNELSIYSNGQWNTVQGGSANISATSPLAYDSETGELSIDLSGYYDSSEVDNLFSSLITKVPTGATAPTTTEQGALWYNSSDGSLYVYFDGFWVEVI